MTGLHTKQPLYLYLPSFTPKTNDMSKVRIIIIALTLGMASMASAQSKRLIAIDTEVGVNVRSSDKHSLARLRGYNAAEKEIGDDRRRKDAYMICWYVGAKPEFRINEKLSFDGGIRFTLAESRLRRKDNVSMKWKFAEKGINTMYISIDRLNQSSLYIGVPVDIRFVPAGLDATSVYLKAGASFNFRSVTLNHVETSQERMQDLYEDEINDQIEKPDSFALPIWMGVGIQFGHEKGACIELTLPYFMNLAQMSSLCKVRGSGIGLQFTYRIPTFRSND